MLRCTDPLQLAQSEASNLSEGLHYFSKTPGTSSNSVSIVLLCAAEGYLTKSKKATDKFSAHVIYKIDAQCINAPRTHFKDT